MAVLLAKLQRYEEANKITQGAVARLSNAESDTAIHPDFKSLQARIFKGLDQFVDAIEAYMGAKEILTRQWSRESGKEAEGLKEKISNIYIKMADIAENDLKDYERAAALFNDCIQFSPQNALASISLAKVQLKQNNIPGAQSILNEIIKQNPDSVEASKLMADLLYKTMSFQPAMVHYRQILETSPFDYEVLSRYIETCYRLGKMEFAEAVLQNASVYTSKAKMNQGYHYCKGLYCRYPGTK